MKKFTSISLALVLAASCFATEAQASLPQPQIKPNPGNIPQWSLGTISLEWNTEISQAGSNLNATAVINNGSPITLRGSITSSNGEDIEPLASNSSGNTLSYDTGDNLNWGSESGTYVITVPAGIVEDEGGNKNDKIVITYNVLGFMPKSDIYINPGENDGSTTLSVSDLRNVTVNFGGIIEPSGVVEDDLPLFVNLFYWEDYEMKSVKTWTFEEVTLNEARTGFIFDLSNLVEDGVTYSFAIPSKFVVVNINGTKYFNSSVDCEYNINGAGSIPLGEAEIIQGPGLDWQQYDSLLDRSVVLTWDQPVFEGIFNGSIQNQSGNIDYLPENIFELSDNVLTINLSETIVEEGAYIVTLGAGSVVNGDGQGNPEQIVAQFLYYTNPDYPVYPEETTFTEKGNGMIVVTWEGNEWISMNPESTDDIYVLDTTDGQKYILESGLYGQISFNNDLDDDVYELIIDVKGLELETGSYTLFIPERILLLEKYIPGSGIIEYINPEASYTFSYVGTTGVDEISVENVYQVYTLQGIKVMEGSDISGLEKGLYIINGKRVLISK